MIKTLTLLGQEHTFRASDGDYYLGTMGSDGPPDIQRVFEVFCAKNGNVIDVGSNIGITAVLAGRLVYPGSVLALEPVRETFDYLVSNVEGSGSTNVRCLNVAAASAPGHVNLVSRPGHSFAAFVGYAEVLDRYAGYAEEDVAALTLDQLVEDEKLSRVDFIKIDVEGFELEVLRGSRLVLQRFQPTVFLEANHYCLNIFRRLSMVDFLEEILSIFPVVYAVDASLEILDLTAATNHPHFFHDNVVLGRYQNLLCGFGPSIETNLGRLSAPVDDALPVHPDAMTLTSATGPRNSRLVSRVRRRFAQTEAEGS